MIRHDLKGCIEIKVNKEDGDEYTDSINLEPDGRIRYSNLKILLVKLT